MAKHCLLVLLLFFGFFPTGTAAAAKDGPVAIQGAMDIEISALLKEMGHFKQESFGGYTYFIGNIGKTPVIVARTGIGMTNAAASTALLIEKYHPSLVINQGTAGGHAPNLNVFDTVIGAEVMNIGKLESKQLGLGQGIRPRTWKFMPTEIRINGKIAMFSEFRSNTALVEAAVRAGRRYEHGKVVVGKIGSSDFWNKEADRILWFHKTAGTSAEEMEAASVAQVAKGFNVPFLSIRTISNSELTGGKFLDLVKAGQYCAEFVVEIVKEL